MFLFNYRHLLTIYEIVVLAVGFNKKYFALDCGCSSTNSKQHFQITNMTSSAR